MRKSTILLALMVAATIFTIVEGACIQDYLAMFMSGICAIILLVGWMIMLEIEEIKETR